MPKNVAKNLKEEMPDVLISNSFKLTGKWIPILKHYWWRMISFSWNFGAYTFFFLFFLNTTFAEACCRETHLIIFLTKFNSCKFWKKQTKFNAKVFSSRNSFSEGTYQWRISLPKIYVWLSCSVCHFRTHLERMGVM